MKFIKVIREPVVFDGGTYVLLAIFTAITGLLSSDEAAKYISPEPLFWWRSTFATLNAGLLALKMYRSTSYSKHVEEKKEEKIKCSEVLGIPELETKEKGKE